MDIYEKDSLTTESYENDELDNSGDDSTNDNNREEDKLELEKLEKLRIQKQKFVKNLKKRNTVANDKEDEEDNLEDQDPSHRLTYLLKQAEVFAHFVLSKNENVKRKPSKSSKKHRNLHKEQDEDSALLRAENEAFDDNENQITTRLEVQPSLLKGGKLRDYQLNGLNWLINLYENGINGILADEMGLGKTIQTISLIAFLKEYKRIHGPYLVIAPKSTLGNWVKEFKKWLPCARLVKLIATKEERYEIIDKYLRPGKFDVCLTSYEGVNICKSALKKFNWKYIIIDEAHKIKNESSLLSKNVRDLNTLYKLLITGTPLQNNLHELWSLLNFLLPDLFSSSILFDQWFEMSSNVKNMENNGTLETENLEFITQLHKILKPFLLRRTKSEVEKSLPPKKEIHLFVGLTEQQVSMYRSILSKKSVTADKKFYLNLLMQLRKVCNHPYLFEGVEEEGLPLLGHHIISVSGKMIMLDKLLNKLKKEKHQVLIFSQMTRMLDILEDYCLYRQYEYCRIDGDTDMDSRDRQISDFVDPNSTKFIFLLSTRAGGLGINLATSDTVIIFDSDWNPQVDLQAMDRAHRIGQKNQVNVYRMICENTLEEKIIERQMIKLKWDTLVIQQGRFQNKTKVFTKDELKDMIQYGASEIFRSNGNNLTDEDIEILLIRGEERTKQHNKKLECVFDKNKNILDLALINLDIYTFDNVDYQKKKKEDEMCINEAFIRQIDSELTTRTRNKYQTPGQKQLKEDYKKFLKTKIPEFRFYKNRDRLLDLLIKESEYLTKIKDRRQIISSSNHSNSGNNGNVKEEDNMKIEDKDEKNMKIISENDSIEQGFTQEDKKEKDYLLSTGFNNWNKDEFAAFIQGCERFSRKEYKKISEHIGTKTPEEIEKYSKIFWERISEIPEYQKILKNIERGETSLQNKLSSQKLIDQKCSRLKNPKEEIEFNSTFYNKSRSKLYTLEHDKFLIYICYIERFGNWDNIRTAIKRESKFRFDHFFKSRTDQELLRRIQSLIRVLEKENEAQPIQVNHVNDTISTFVPLSYEELQRSIRLKTKFHIEQVNATNNTNNNTNNNADKNTIKHEDEENFAIKKKSSSNMSLSQDNHQLIHLQNCEKNENSNKKSRSNEPNKEKKPENGKHFESNQENDQKIHKEVNVMNKIVEKNESQKVKKVKNEEKNPGESSSSGGGITGNSIGSISSNSGGGQFRENLDQGKRDEKNSKNTKIHHHHSQHSPHHSQHSQNHSQHHSPHRQHQHHHNHQQQQHSHHHHQQKQQQHVGDENSNNSIKIKGMINLDTNNKEENSNKLKDRVVKQESLLIFGKSKDENKNRKRKHSEKSKSSEKKGNKDIKKLKLNEELMNSANSEKKIVVIDLTSPKNK